MSSAAGTRGADGSFVGLDGGTRGAAMWAATKGSSGREEGTAEASPKAAVRPVLARGASGRSPKPYW